MLGSTVVVVEISLIMGCILRIIMKLGEVVVEFELGVEVLRNRICWVDELLEDNDIIINLCGRGES